MSLASEKLREMTLRRLSISLLSFGGAGTGAPRGKCGPTAVFSWYATTARTNSWYALAQPG